MIPLYKKITHSSSFSFSSSMESPPEFDTPWHYHPEYELILIMNSQGTRFMGDNISNFGSTEVVLIGPNLPHFWKEEVVQPTSQEAPYACVIHFSEHFLGEKMFDLPEGSKIKSLLNRSRFGLAFGMASNAPVIEKIEKLITDQGFDRILNLLQILDELSKSKKYQKLSSEGFINFFNKKNSKKINVAVEYAMNNFKDKITLEEIADSVHMSKSSFCRFFKRSTGKTYFDFLREIRIGYACKLILENNLSITQIAYECGYENISNFNRQFKITKSIVPIKYKQQVQGSNISL